MALKESAFRGKSAIVTGGASGIGLAIGRELQAVGAHVTLADINGRASKAARQLPSGNGRQHDVVGVDLDVTDRVGFQQVVGRIRDAHGQLDLLFNNAGITLGGPTDQISPEAWDHVIDVNIRGVIHGIEAALPGMIEQGSGQIVNTASAAGIMAAPYTASYSMSKYAVVGLSQALRPEAALQGIGVTVLCPGMVETPILDQPPSDAGALTPRAYLETLGLKPISAESFARTALTAVAKNKPIVVTPANVKIGWRLSRHTPRLHHLLNRAVAKRVARAMGERSVERSFNPER